jgi:hypothetical protein
MKIRPVAVIPVLAGIRAAGQNIGASGDSVVASPPVR